MRTHTIKVRGRRASIDDRMLVQGTVGEDVLALDLDEEWDGFVVTVAFKWQHDSSIVAKQVEGGYEVPWECNQHPGKVLVAIEGALGGKVMRHATIDYPMVVLPSEDAGGAAPSDPTVGELRQAYEDAKTATESAAEAAGIAKAAASAASSQAETAKQSAASADAAADAAREAAVDVKRRADSGEFKGEKGDPGPKLTFADLTEADKAELQKPATDAAATANAAAKAANDAADAANTANDAADAANTAANQAVSDARDAIAEVKATEAKLYPAAENILVGSETGAVAHVDDAFDGSTLRKITVEGACKQDGIPSPESPKPITVIEHPAVKVVGRNLWPFASSYTSIEGHQNEFVNDKTPFAILPGAYTFSAAGSLGNTDAPLFGYTATGKRIQLFRIFRNVTNPKYSFTVTEPITSVYFISNAADSNTGTISSIQLERNSTATEYKPHTSQTLTFILPAEHPYLAKLPDGTADEITVDEEGNVELVARVARRVLTTCFTVSSSASQPGEDGTMNYVLIVEGAEDVKVANAAACICTRFKDGGTTKNSDTIRRGAGNGLCYIYTSNAAIIGDGTTQHVTEWLAANPTEILYEVAEPTRYPLGKIDMPKAQDSIVNVWTDAEVTPNTGIEYVRDVNIVVANIESAIASITEG